MRLVEVIETVRTRLSEAVAGDVDTYLEDLPLPARRRELARQALVEERLGPVRFGGCWLLRLPPGSSFLAQAREAGVLRWLGRFIGVYSLAYGLLLFSWWLLGRGALEGRLAEGWLLAWGLVFLTLMPLRAVNVWARSRLAVGTGALLKRRLLQGALRLAPDSIRHQGVGQLLGRVIESEAIEALALDGGFLGVVGVIELAFAGWVLAQGAGGWLHVGLFGAWLVASLLLGRRFFLARLRWTESRLEMTHDFVERLVGHRTRLAQEPREEWHEEEDAILDRYLVESRRMDTSKTHLLASLPRGWLILGIAGLGPAVVAGGSSTARLAIGLGGVLAAARGFTKVGEGVNHLAGAAIGWLRAKAALPRRSHHGGAGPLC